MHSSQFGITFTDSRGPVNSDGPIHCIRSLNRMVRYSVMPVCATSTPGEALTLTSTPLPSLPSQPSQPSHPTETQGRRPNSRPRSQTGSRSRSGKRPDGQQQGLTQGPSKKVQSTIDGWFQEYEADKIRKSQKEWGGPSAPSEDQL